MRKFLASLLMLAAAVLVMPAALAAEEVPIVLPLEPVFAEPVLEQQAGAMLFSEPVWNGSHSNYRDQLTAEEKEVYDKIVGVFSAFAQNMKKYAQAEDCRLGRTSMDIPVTDENGEPVVVDGIPLVNHYELWAIDDVIEVTWQIEQWGVGEEIHSSLPATFQEHFDRADAIVKRAGAAIALDHPEFFWIRQSCVADVDTNELKSKYIGGTNTPEDPAIFEMNISFDAAFVAYPASDSVDDCTQLQEALNKVIDDILSGAEEHVQRTRNQLGVIEKKLEYVDNWLAEHNDYNEPAAAEASWIYRDETPWSIVGALLDNYSPVCEGYAKAFQLICHKLGLPCLQVSGDAYQLDEDGNVDYDSGGAHMWNVVRLNGTWYFCDPTWDDPVYEGGSLEYSSREYLLTDQPAGHFTDMQFATPECGTKYFTFDASDVDQIIDELEEDANFEGSDTWEKTENGISGYEVGKGTMMVALYDDGQMLGIVTCQVVYEGWRESDWNVYSISGIDAELLSKADKIVRFNMDTSYSPIRAVREIEEERASGTE